MTGSGAPMSPDSPSNQFWPVTVPISNPDTDGDQSSARSIQTAVLLPLLPNGINCSFVIHVACEDEQNTCSCKSKD